MSILVVGSVALDSVKTPFGEKDDALGGSAVYFSVSASYFTDVRMVAVIGRDFPEEHVNLLKKHKIDVDGLQKAEGKTFRWKGEYTYDLNQANTLDTQLNVFASFKPEIPEKYKNSEFIFLANIDPELQKQVVKQVKKPKIVACDTMNFWISGKKKELLETLKLVNILIINEAEARQLTGETNLVKAAAKIRSYGPESVVIKRGEYGALLFSKDHVFSAPAYPLEVINDPTGAGDSFAGGFMGYLAGCGKTDEQSVRQAMIVGSAMASFNVEDFSLGRLSGLSPEMIKTRCGEFRKLTSFEIIK
ncbi:MAG: bifunctional hydroxymethylpyrimidine kinase/phosphomethylpyrimidine kinase [Endomicrobiales bacterium]|nr:bifunctional hydroxymethylpyrimidine kinase/phosphomethylpyrimidine kinase [Endomicrobiales bacterium]